MDEFIDVRFLLQIGLTEVVVLRRYHSEMERIIASSKSWRLAAVKKRAKRLPEHLRETFVERNFPYEWELSFPAE